jgi:hypothetical protein
MVLASYTAVPVVGMGPWLPLGWLLQGAGGTLLPSPLRHIRMPPHMPDGAPARPLTPLRYLKYVTAAKSMRLDRSDLCHALVLKWC